MIRFFSFIFFILCSCNPIPPICIRVDKVIHMKDISLVKMDSVGWFKYPSLNVNKGDTVEVYWKNYWD